MVNLKALHSSDPKINQLRDSEFYRLLDSNNLYLRVDGSNRRVLCSTSDLRYGIGTSSPSSKLEINDDNGSCLYLRSIYGTANFSFNASGSLVLYTSNELSLSTALNNTSGGTGYSTYSSGDLLVGQAPGLAILNKPTQVGYQLVSNGTSLEWSSHIFEKYLKMDNPVYQSPGIYTVNVYCRNYLDTNFIKLSNASVGTLASSGILGSCIVSSELTTISTTSSFVVNDTITINGVSKKIISASPSSITIGSSFAFHNRWTLSGAASMSAAQFKFGTKSLLATSTAMYATSILGSSFTSPQSAWTIEFFFRLNAVTAALSLVASTAANTLVIDLALAPVNITVSVGQGTTFNIMNASRLGTALVANTWYHFALSFNGTAYRSFVNGVLLNTTNSSLQIPATVFSSMKIAGGAKTFNGYIDEFRVSNVARYSSAFAVTTSPFINDANTLFLNHFEASTVTQSDDNSTGSMNFSRNGGYDSTQSHILYTYATELGIYYSFRPNEQNLVDINTANVRKIPLVQVVSNGVFRSIEIINDIHLFDNYISILDSLTNTVTVATSLTSYIPPETILVRLLITHTHVGNISCGVVVNGNQYLTTLTASSTQLIVDIPITNIQINSYLSAVASTTNYSIQLIGFSI